jgi:membrane fusion protein (multidrug efflux system)
VQLVSTGDIASYYHATATLEAEKQAEVLARVSGVIGSLACEEGDLVREGQELLRIDNDEYQLRLDQAAATTANLKARHDRLANMLAEELTSTEEYEAVKSELASAEADEGMARLSVSYTSVTAPFTGKVTQRLVDVGQNVNENTPLFIIADFTPLLARVHVPAKEFRKLRQDQAVQLVLDSDQKRLQGRIKLISPVIDPTSGTIKLTVEIPEYPAGTRPGDFADVHIVTERRTGTTLVPRIAVISDKGEDIVFVATGISPGVAAEDSNAGPRDPGEASAVAERRIVEVGFTDSDHAEILSGLQPGEVIVVKGQRSLKHGDPLKILEGLGLMTAQTPATQHGEGP